MNTPLNIPLEPEMSTLALISQRLASCGYLILDSALPEAVMKNLSDYLQNLQLENFKHAGIGRDKDFHVDTSIRGDEIHWLSHNDSSEQYFQWIEQLRLELNQNLFLGLFDFETHFAHYPPGAFYKRHYDGFKGNPSRIVTTILYLNQDWQKGDGGELCLYDGTDQLLETILPSYGRMVIFLSEDFPHEVLPAKRDRYSLTGWLRLNQNRM